MSVQILSDSAKNVLKTTYGLEDVSIPWEMPQDPEHGDRATPVSLQVAKKAEKQPREIAQAIAQAFDQEEFVVRTEVAGPGYINVWLTPSAIVDTVRSIPEACTPQETRTDEQPVVIEYSQPNIAKPLGIHHIMSTMIGQAVANLHTHLGYNTITVNHFGDWGTQFGKLAVALEKWGEKSVQDSTLDELLALYVRFHEEAEQDASLDDAAREAFKKLEDGDERITAFWKDVVKVSMDALNELYERLDVHIEHPHGEAMYQDMMAPILEEGLQKNVFKEGEKGAIVVGFPEEKNLSTAVVQKADAATIYMTRDFAQIRYRIDRWKPKSIFYVVDVAQSLHFQQLFAAVEMLGWDLPHLEHLVVGRMSFKDKKMSTRKGNILKLHEVLDEAVDRAKKTIQDHGDSIQTDNEEELAEMMGVGSVVYGVLSQNRKMNMIFDWDKFLSFDGNSAPYLQYTYARARSVLRKSELEHPALPTNVEELSAAERELITKLSLFPGVLEEAREALMPHILGQYLFGLCQAFNSFYNADSILQADTHTKELRLALTHLTATVLSTGASILTLRVPERM